MPEWVLITLAAVLLTGLLCWVVGVALGALALIHGFAGLGRRVRAARIAREAAFARESTVWVACHTPQCGHMERRHRTTAAGLVCTRCGNVPTSSAP
ncbi:hypothetical protein [Streptomyces sp. NPDC008125]|uniref:hypothetical protein n=1 Tax=Streptomyces sp. NPDC008125 TaxID=3364811 RepID=UPI0036EC50F8